MAATRKTASPAKPKNQRPQSAWIAFPEAGVFSWFGPLEPAIPLGLYDLTTEGMTRVDTKHPAQLTALKGQLAAVRTVGRQDRVEIWTDRAALAQIERFPVALAFHSATIPPTDDGTIPIFQALPPPNLGECAFLWNGTSWTLLERAMLRPDGISLQLQLRDAIADLAAPADAWWTEPDLMAALADDQERDQALNHLETLALQQKRRRTSPARWEASWQQLQHLARQLAEAYWLAANPSTTQMAIADLSVNAVTVPADTISQQIMRSLLTAAEFQLDAEHQAAVWQPPLPERTVTIQLSQQEGETWRQMMDHLSVLGDEAVDTFCALLAMALATNGGADLARPFYVSPEMILAFMGRQESARIYTVEQRSLIIGILNTLARVQVSATIPHTQKRKRVYRLSSAILDLHSSTVGEYRLDTGEILWQQRLVSLGNWAAIAPQLSSNTVLILRKVLAYHPQRDRFAKRIGRWLTLQFSSHPALVLPMRELLTHAGVPIDKNHPDRTRRLIEAAFAELIQDHILGEATMIVDATPGAASRAQRIAQCTRGWWQDFELTEWQFTPATQTPVIPSATL
ncbi:MAG: hypothetical protein H0X24_03400 [Ktedonobacterales bacterium]|nr:hypothetical protein [Ktedonobacterales bacterium]